MYLNEKILDNSVRFLLPDKTVKFCILYAFSRVHRADLMIFYKFFLGTQPYPYESDNIIFRVHPNKYYCLKYHRHNDFK